MKPEKQTATLPKKNYKISLAVRSKFFLLLLISLALIFDEIVRPPSSKLFYNQSSPEVPAAK